VENSCEEQKRLRRQELLQRLSTPNKTGWRVGQGHD
jgi:hypothetical protein